MSLSVTNVLLSSNFTTNGLQGWAVSPLNLASNWSVVNQALRYNGGGHTQLFAGNSAWSDYVVEVGVKLRLCLITRVDSGAEWIRYPEDRMQSGFIRRKV